MGLSAHPFASYLDGPFVSFGMDVGGGSIAHEYFYDPPINAVKQQAYQTKLKAYQEAIAKIKANQTQTINTLKIIAGQLANLTPTSPQATTLLAKLNALNTDNQTPAAIQKAWNNTSPICKKSWQSMGTTTKSASMIPKRPQPIQRVDQQVSRDHRWPTQQSRFTNFAKCDQHS
ncbi:hypothetical protein NHP21005_10710 [Helicobacter sp. NHP21005]|uniref:hypothetical protein n=1 Tax=Helicobacter felistomachi TaxID=3040201 RepID=UPI00257290AB|nr:hypothetical protein [Helicobacter sp. NHP21005]BEG57383.1 hypothetical protein NHP21005_10710 [Helicobacter sp. NHP21005]